jgi:N-glycosylase/DNA lyase
MADDPFLHNAIAYGAGLRMLRQDLWEVIVSFIISQRNNIPRIKSTIEKLCAPYAYVFPPPHILAQYDEKDFRNLGLGYRARYLMDIVANVKTGAFDMEYLKTLNSGEAIAYLKNFNGIGEKVANCIALYGLHRLEAFPIDTWISQVIRDQYNGNFDIKNFPITYAGLIQQYMFFYQRSLRRKINIS